MSASIANPANILALDDEVVMLRDSARGFLAERWPADRAVAESLRPESLRRIWEEIGRQGWLALGADSGGGELRFLMALMEVLGRAGCPAPLLDAYLCNRLLAGAPAAGDLLAKLHEGKAATSIALGALDGDPNAGSLTLARDCVSGRVSFVEGTSIATHFIAPIGKQVAVVEASAVSITPTPGHSVPPLAEVEFRSSPAIVVEGNARMLEEASRLARLGLAARALGAASRGFDLIVDYAKERSQFGRKIGQFQAIQHKLANALINLDASRLALRRATASYDRANPDWAYACGAAVSVASPALRQVCLETHHAFGGVSFWEEHEMPRHFRRIHADLTRCGGVHAAREDIARALLDEAT